MDRPAVELTSTPGGGERQARNTPPRRGMDSVQVRCWLQRAAGITRAKTPSSKSFIS